MKSKSSALWVLIVLLGVLIAFVVSGKPQSAGDDKPAAKLTKWDYNISLGAGNEKALNLLGEEGWELVLVYDKWFYFKRPKP